MGIFSFAVASPAIAAVAVVSYVVLRAIRTSFKVNAVSNPKAIVHASENGPDVIVVGAGILGSAMAVALAKDGRKVTLIERDMSEPDRIVGELLQPGGVSALKKLGLEDCLEGIDAVVERGYYVHYKGKSVQLPYPEGDSGKQMIGRSFHHGRFIMNLREAVKREKNVTIIEGIVSNLMHDESDKVILGVEYNIKGEHEMKKLYAPLTIIADGCFSKFRKELVKSEVQVPSHFVGFVLKNCSMFKENHAEVVLAKPSPILFYQISSTETRVLVDIRPPVPSAGNGDLKKYLVEFVAPQLPEHLKSTFLTACETERLRSMPNSYLPPVPIKKAGALLLGDALNMRHPLTGGGMTVAFNDVCIWQNLLREVPDLRDHKTVLKQLKRFHWNRKSNHSFVVNVLAQALYALFSATDEHLESLREACFDYFNLGGECAAGPISLLSVLTPSPMLLISHFFAVAFYAIFKIFSSTSIFLPHKAIIKSFSTLYAACLVIFPLILSEMKWTR